MSEFHECVVGTFDKELQALIDYGHDCCARIDDRIYECCQRIREAHDVEVGSYQIALTWMHAATMPQYDVLDNERHKAVCELRKSDFTLYTPEQFVETLYKMLYMTGGAPTNIFVMQKAVRDRLIYLLSGDTAEVEDGMDAGRCDETNAAVGVPAADKRRADCDDNQPSEEVASITTELREYVQDWRENPNLMDDLDAGDIDGLLGDFEHIADRIDAEHERICYDYQREHDDWIYIRDTCWVELPKDADGVPIHIGDSMEWVADDDCSDFCPIIREVEAIGTGVFFVWDKVGGRFAQYLAGNYRHHHAPTVEDVLFSYGQACIRASNEAKTDAAKQTMLAKLREEYAAKLRLSDANA